MPKRTTYPPEVRKFIAANIENLTEEELTMFVNSEFGTSYTVENIHYYRKNHKLKAKKKVVYSDVFPKPIALYIIENYKGIGPKEMSEILNKKFDKTYTQAQLKGFYANHNLNSGLTGQFKKGHVPFCKGMKGYHAPGSEKGWFKKGQKSQNIRSVGSERVNVYGYIEIKVEDPNKWRLKHNVVWEEHFGEIPKGNKIIFLDGNTLNCEIENLAMVSNDELLEMNRKGLRWDDPEATKTGILIAKVGRAAAKRKKGGDKQCHL